MATIVAVERKWISKDAGLERIIQIADFLNKADAFNGIYPHFMNAETGKTIPFDRVDNGADLVETSYIMMGFLCAREYFKGDSEKEKYLRTRINQMWNAANWGWFDQEDHKYLFWHWSPQSGFDMHFPIWGYNEALITYIMGASSPMHPISRKVYDNNWVGSTSWKNGKSYYGYKLPLGNFEGGGPLFFEQYTYMVVDPNDLKDEHGIDYKEQVVNHTLINRAYCIDNPKKYKGYGSNYWGLTAGDSYKGYVAHCPQDDRGVIQPTAAISSMPFTPKESMEVLRHLYDDLGYKVWDEYRFYDGISEHHNWVSNTHLAIDQGPIIAMIENYRTGLIWKLFMNIPEVQQGMKNLGFTSPYFK